MDLNLIIGIVLLKNINNLIYKSLPNLIHNNIDIAKPNTNPAIQGSWWSSKNGRVTVGVIKNVKNE